MVPPTHAVCGRSPNERPTMIRISNNGRNWATVRFAVDDQSHPAIVALIGVPGVSVVGPTVGSDGWLEVPRSAWPLPAWSELERTAGRPSQAHWTVELWTPTRPLFAHQIEGATQLVSCEGGLCAFQMGLGKTATAITAAESYARREGQPEAARLIIAPGFTRDVWKRELLALGAITDEREFCAVETRNPMHPSFRPKEAKWWFVHFDVVGDWASRLVTNARGKPIVAIVDEAHWIKNSKTKRAAGTLAAAGVAQCRILLTGTPMANRPAELWSLLTLVDGTRAWGSPVEFRQRYCGAYFDGHWVDGAFPTNTEELQQRLSARYMRREVGDVGLELPELSREVLEVDMSDADRVEHMQVAHDLGGIRGLLEAFDRGAFGSEVLRALHRLRQLTSQVKFATTKQHVASCIEQGEPVVVFCWERRMAHKLAAVLEDVNGEPAAFVVTGDHDQRERDDMVRRFQAGERMAVIATFGALKEGVTLHRARMVVLHDLSWVPADVLQAEARIHRIGQQRGCVSVWPMVHDSFDTILARHLAHKGASIAMALGDERAAQAATATGLASFGGLSIEDEAERLLRAWT